MARKILHVVDVAHAGDYRLALRFNDGTAGLADLTGHLTGYLEPLRAPELFAQAHIEYGTVVWPGEFDLAAEYLYALAHKLPTPITGDDVLTNQLEVTLRELRAIAGKTQADVAEFSGLAQGDVSRLERRDDMLLTTLRRYIEALGGEVDIVARFGNRQLRVSIG